METVDDPTVLLGNVAALLAARRPLPEALALVVEGLGLHSAVLREEPGPAGALLAVAGEVVHAVPAMRRVPGGPSVELPVHGGDGRGSATLTVVGARPAQLPALRAVAAVLGLALAGTTAAPALLAAEAQALLAAADEDDDLLADDLHDGPVQALLAARYACDAVVRGADPRVARDAVQVAVVALRRTLWDLRPRGADDLADALDALSARRVEAGAPPLDLALDDAAAYRLSPPARVLLYRFVQSVAGEGAGPVRVVVRALGDAVALDLDSGGLLSGPDRWRRRLRALGGDLVATGGRVRLVLPVPAADRPDPRPRPVRALAAAAPGGPPHARPLPLARRVPDATRTPSPKACS